MAGRPTSKFEINLNQIEESLKKIKSVSSHPSNAFPVDLLTFAQLLKKQELRLALMIALRTIQRVRRTIYLMMFCPSKMKAWDLVGVGPRGFWD